MSTIIKVFSNQTILVTITDNDKFGSTFSAKRVPLDVENDPMAMMMMGSMPGVSNDFGAFDPELDGEDFGPAPLPKDTIEV